MRDVDFTILTMEPGLINKPEASCVKLIYSKILQWSTVWCKEVEKSITLLTEWSNYSNVLDTKDMLSKSYKEDMDVFCFIRMFYLIWIISPSLSFSAISTHTIYGKVTNLIMYCCKST